MRLYNCIIALILMTFVSHASFAQQAGDAVLTTLANNSLNNWTSFAFKWLHNRNEFGLTLSTTALTTPAHLQITWTDGDKRRSQACSGVLIGSKKILTAAHCICGTSQGGWFADTAKKCEPMLAKIAVAAHFPTSGIYLSKGPFEIHPSYTSSESITDKTTETADLAVITLNE